MEDLSKKRIVPGCGPSDAKIAIIGEAPGASEETQGVPFVGSSGQLLNSMLLEAGIDRTRCWVDNVVPIRPDKNNFGSLPKAFVDDCAARLRARLKIIKPNVIAAVGDKALEALTGKSGISKYRGSILAGFCGKTIPVYHPSYIMRQWLHRSLAVFDLRRVNAESETGDLNLPEFHYEVDPSYARCFELLEAAKSEEYCSFDIETLAGTKPQCIGFSCKPDTAFCIPFRRRGVPRWTPQEEIALWKKIDELLYHPGPKKIAQNLMFDAHVLHSELGIRVANFWMDTMLMFNLLYAELPKGLDTITSIYTRYPYYKDMFKNTHTDNVLWEYNCHDCNTTLISALGLAKDCKEVGQWDYYRNHIQALIWPLLDAQAKGFRIDHKLRAKAVEQYNEEIESLGDAISRAAGRQINPKSPKQLKELLYKDLKFAPQYKRGTRSLTTDETAMNALQKKYPNHPVFQLILDYRGKSKIVGTYLQAKTDADGRMRCSYNIAGTDTGRIASSQSVAGTGTNMQNQPKGIVRETFIADEGMKLLNVDLSQAEARVVAYLAQEEGLIHIFESGGDVHSAITTMVFGSPEKREIGKRLGHASNYDMSWHKFSLVAGIPEKEAKIYHAMYHSTFPRIRVWHKTVQQQLQKGRILHDLFGGRRMFFGRWGPELFRQGYAFVPQTTVARLLNMAMVRFHAADVPTAAILVNTHDGMVIQYDEKEETLLLEVLARAFEHTFELHGRKFKIPFEVTLGHNWNEIS